MTIASLIRRLTEAGAPPEAIAIAVEAVEAERTKEADRRTTQAAKKREYRANLKLVQGQSKDSPRTVHSPPPCSNTPPLSSSLPNGSSEGAQAAPKGEEVELFQRGKVVLGKQAGGLIANLLRAKGGQIPLARAVIETASTKASPREYVGAVIRGPPDTRPLTPSGNPWPEGII